MLDLLKNTEEVLLFTLWCLSASLVFLSITVALWLSMRRIYRNRRQDKVREHQEEFEGYIQFLLDKDTIPSDFVLPAHIRSDRTAVTAGLLKYYKLVSGDDALKLNVIVERLDLERIIQAAISWGNRGKRMRAFNVLSFMDTSSSLKTICKYLYSTDKYVRLSVARCIARRRVISLVSEVIESLSFAFPDDEKILTDVISRFGTKAIPRIETIAEKHTDPTVISGILEALINLRPENCRLDMQCFIDHPDERVRAAAVELSTILDRHNDLLPVGLADNSRKVKIRSLKVAAREKRTDCFADLYRLMNDPFMWVRYWAMQAALKTGQSGETLMKTLSRQPTIVGDLAIDVLREQ